ncbi:putative peptidyl-arginine deiminase [Sphingomonas changbaiensis NBRC 104936]|uniref:Putative peptidyl-arginine deiminase n=1 Tax=Sphingomonas changbaiensis NBRC 104936 TaxID=1219043 RepID=A0A0E9MM94_9SPHN|nr:agmatine deiminase family protein [Sphingomonas changbaiensis]GAO38887.1 putative peptidyl-arginine deiminase [Sphingomonas changbaiensis NBRC 104936]
MNRIERQPPEWAPHESVWIGFPSHAELWEDDLDPARAEVIAFADAVHAGGAGETVRLVAADRESAEVAARLAPAGVEIVTAPFGDIWLRDTGPIIVSNGERRAARSFLFNGWGGKYRLEGDDDLALRLVESGGFGEARRCKYVLEGGAIDVDGTGLAVTTEQCLLNPNRNPDLSKAEIEARLLGDLGLDRILWLGNGLLNDHTDGHVDNLARFVGEGRIAIPERAGEDDPNAAVYRDAQARARAFGLDVVPLPSPGRVLRDGEIIPASYMNFYIGNAAVVVPLYGAPNDQAAIAAIQQLFPSRRVVGFRADHILTGGGSFHCISQQVPSL